MKWNITVTDIDFSKYEPISTSHSLHIFEEIYEIDGVLYRLIYEIGDSEPMMVQKKRHFKVPFFISFCIYVFRIYQ
jgi:hypothetical protein